MLLFVGGKAGEDGQCAGRRSWLRLGATAVLESNIRAARAPRIVRPKITTSDARVMEISVSGIRYSRTLHVGSFFQGKNLKDSSNSAAQLVLMIEQTCESSSMSSISFSLGKFGTSQRTRNLYR
mmetsp:Transcript_58188/g.127699  ORF Transcript_58188/g.127699 Transcript_58188/m.127699 type:complete len:124 (+) Transcript_58188:1097-1468(+)